LDRLEKITAGSQSAEFENPVLGSKIFRSIRAGIIYDSSDLGQESLQSVRKLYGKINVELIQSNRLWEVQGYSDFGIIGVLGEKALDKSKGYLEDFPCLKIGFHTDNGSLTVIRSSLKLLDAFIVCYGSRTVDKALGGIIFHFYGSLTLPSLLNIDLADVDSIASGIGISFNTTGEDSDQIISSLPREFFLAKSALLHFCCKKNVTLEEVYEISKAISIRQNINPYIVNSLIEEKKLYRRINIKMGLRIAEAGENQSKTIATETPRISLTAILFGF